MLLGNGDGTFQASIDTALPFGNGSTVTAMAVGDVNGNGIPDVAVTDNTDRAVLMGKGDSDFDSAPFVDLPRGDHALTLADVNRDGILDVIDNAVEVAFGKGDGTFERPIYWPVAPQSVTLRDVGCSGGLG